MENATQTQTKTHKCTPSQLAYGKDYYSTHREERLVYQKAYDAAHKDERKAYQKAYCSAHKSEKKAYDKEYNAIHNDVNKAYVKSYRCSHPSYRLKELEYSKKYQSRVSAALSHRIREWLDDNGYISYVGHHYDYGQPFKVIILPKCFHQNLHSYLEKVEVDGFETYQLKSNKKLIKGPKSALNYAAFLLEKEGFDFKPFILDFEGLFPTVVDID